MYFYNVKRVKVYWDTTAPRQRAQAGMPGAQLGSDVETNKSREHMVSQADTRTGSSSSPTFSSSTKRKCSIFILPKLEGADSSLSTLTRITHIRAVKFNHCLPLPHHLSHLHYFKFRQSQYKSKQSIFLLITLIWCTGSRSLLKSY